MNIWFVSDSHFNHDNIIRLSRRPAENVTDMNELMIQRWNEAVKDDDTVYHLGDFAYPPKNEHHMTFDEIGARLKGKKILIRGNHDRERMKETEKGQEIFNHWMWDFYSDYEELKYGKTRIMLFHYPIDTWRNAHHGALHFHGHVHCNSSQPGQKFYKPHRFDMGVDRQERGEDIEMFARPWHIDQIRDLLNAQTDYDPVSHHADQKEITMSVLACNRNGCRNVMCDRLSYEWGYLCDDCFAELQATQPDSLEIFMGNHLINHDKPKIDYSLEFKRQRLVVCVVISLIQSKGIDVDSADSFVQFYNGQYVSKSDHEKMRFIYDAVEMVNSILAFRLEQTFN